MKQYSKRIVAAGLFVVGLAIFVFFFKGKPANWNKSTIEKYENELNALASYMIFDSKKGFYLRNSSYQDSYTNFTFPEDILEAMEIFFTDIASARAGGIYVFREDTAWYWNKILLPPEINIVSFAIDDYVYGYDSDTGNEMYEFRCFYYTNASEAMLRAILRHDKLHSYTVCEVKENWYLVASR